MQEYQYTENIRISQRHIVALQCLFDLADPFLNTGLKPGARADHVRNQLAVAQIRRLYQEKGYELAEVALIEGGKPNDRNAIFQIFEGPKCRVTSISFTGNAFASDATLKTKIRTKPVLLGVIRGKYHREDVEDDVEVGALCAIDRAAMGETRVGRGTKIDNLVQVGHSVTIGSDTVLAGQVGIAGSTRVGDKVTLAGQVGVAGHLNIGDGVIATAQTGIPSSVERGQVVSGYPAIDNRDWLKASAVFARLPELQRRVRELEKRLKELEGDEESTR